MYKRERERERERDGAYLSKQWQIGDSNINSKMVVSKE